jgi:cytochrome c556
MRRILTTVSTALLIAAAAASLAHAETSPANAIKYRKAVMSAIGGHVGAFFLINGGAVDQGKYLVPHAEALAALGEQIPVLFPAGSGTGKTDALPKIWEEPAKFSEAANAGKDATAKLLTAVKSGDKAAIAAAAKGLGEACKGCHDRYRKEEKKAK